MKVCFETFGCRLNKAEALQMEAEYLAKGWELTDKHADANLFVVRGCSVTRRAQSDCEALIAHLKKSYPSVPIKICGCIEDNLATSKFATRARRLVAKTDATKADEEIADGESPVPTRTARAYLKVQDGCSGKCTFCIVPKFRGSSRSVPLADVLSRAARFIDAGYHEIVVTGCNLSLYASEGKRLPELLAELASLSADCRIRLGSLEPGACAIETVHAIAENANVCRFLHIPVQSGSNRILMAMKRPYQIRDVDALVSNAMKLMPRAGLGCDLMTGFPDESEIDFRQTKALFSRLPFNNAHIFPYSERPGTLAAAFGGVIPKPIRSARAHELSHLIRHSREQYAKSFIGKTVEIVSEGEKHVHGWTGEYLKCDAVGTVPRKAKVKVFVNRVRGDHLYGKLEP